MMAQDQNWATPALSTKLKGKWVEFTGWMLFDSMHMDGAENTNPGGDKNWRATCWEIHPVTSFKVLDEAPPVAATLTPAAVGAMRKAHVAHVGTDAGVRAAIEARNKKYLDKFDPIEKQEKEAEASERRP
jgi:hypothetical protein